MKNRKSPMLISVFAVVSFFLIKFGVTFMGDKKSVCVEAADARGVAAERCHSTSTDTE